MAFEEGKSDLVTNVASLGFDLEQLEHEGVIQVMRLASSAQKPFGSATERVPSTSAASIDSVLSRMVP